MSRQRLSYSETARQLQRRLRECDPSNLPDVRKELAQAKRKQGPTVFDWLVEIIEANAKFVTLKLG